MNKDRLRWSGLMVLFVFPVLYAAQQPTRWNWDAGGRSFTVNTGFPGSMVLQGISGSIIINGKPNPYIS